MSVDDLGWEHGGEFEPLGGAGGSDVDVDAGGASSGDGMGACSHAHKHAAGHGDERGGAPAYDAFVITVSDRASQGVYADEAGPAVCALLAAQGYDVAGTAIVPDVMAAIEQTIRDAAASGVALVVTSGGTGLSPRDVTPEATANVCERMVPGFGEAMRTASARITPFAWLSRATAGTLGRTLVLNVPGSPKAATENLEAVLVPVAHALKTLRATGPLDCAKEQQNLS